MNIATFLRPLRSGMLAVATLAITLTGCDKSEDDTGGDTDAATSLPMTGGMDDGMDDGGSADSTGGDGGSMLSHEADIQPIWEKYCVAGCHEPGGLWPTFDQSGGAAENYEQIVNMPSPTQAPTMNLITPGEPDESYMWHKINGTQVDAGGSGVVMPDKRPEESEAMTLTAEELDTLEQWILDGAPE